MSGLSLADLHLTKQMQVLVKVYIRFYFIYPSEWDGQDRSVEIMLELFVVTFFISLLMIYHPLKEGLCHLALTLTP